MTCFNLLTKFLPPTGGTITCKGADINVCFRLVLAVRHALSGDFRGSRMLVAAEGPVSRRKSG
jgi:ABC-type branched-subunit amino acid transport system ATPase component